MAHKLVAAAMAKSLDFGGEESFQANPEQLFALLTDLDRMAATIPDLESSTRTGPHSMECVVKPGFSFVRGTMQVAMTVDELAPPSSARMLVEAKGIGVSMRITSTLRISEAGGGSQLLWAARVDEMKGLVATVSPALIRAAADQVIRRSWQQMRVQLGEA